MLRTQRDTKFTRRSPHNNCFILVMWGTTLFIECKTVSNCFGFLKTINHFISIRSYWMVSRGTSVFWLMKYAMMLQIFKETLFCRHHKTWALGEYCFYVAWPRPIEFFFEFQQTRIISDTICLQNIYALRSI